jgi:hypothetical protein
MYPCSTHRTIHITPCHRFLGHSVMGLLVPGGPHPATARGRSKGRCTVSPTTHPTIKKSPPPKGYRCLPRCTIRIQPHHTLFKDSVTQLMVPGGGHRTMSRGQSKEDLGGGQHVTSASTAENWPPLALSGNSTQTEETVMSLQCAEATGKRAWLLDNERGSIE